MEVFYGKRSGLEQVVVCQVLGDFRLLGLGAFESGQGDMGREWPFFRGDAEAPQVAFNFSLQLKQARLGMNTGPENFGAALGRKAANTFELTGKGSQAFAC